MGVVDEVVVRLEERETIKNLGARGQFRYLVASKKKCARNSEWRSDGKGLVRKGFF